MTNRALLAACDEIAVRMPPVWRSHKRACMTAAAAKAKPAPVGEIAARLHALWQRLLNLYMGRAPEWADTHSTRWMLQNQITFETLRLLAARKAERQIVTIESGDADLIKRAFFAPMLPTVRRAAE